MQKEIDTLLAFGLFGIAGHRLRVGHGAAKARTRPHQVSDEQPDDKRECRDDLEIDQRFDADTPDFLGVLDMRNAGDHRAEDDRRDHHLDQLDEAVAQRLDLIAGTSAAPSAFLMTDAATNGAIPTSQAFSTPSFMPNARHANPAARMTTCPSPIATKSSGTERSQPRSLNHPVMTAAATKPKR